ncbi:MAG: OmpA family protein [Gammaproteobacteria bacterium]
MNLRKRCLFRVVGLLLTLGVLIACGPTLPIQDEAPALQRGGKSGASKRMVEQSKPPVVPMPRGVAQGVMVDRYQQFNSLQEYGIFIADSREGTHVILPGDRLFVSTVPDVVLQPDFYIALNNLARILIAYPTVNIAVIGHTSNTMSGRMQAEVSLNEARVVADYLSTAGVSPARISRVDGMGARQPISEENDFVGRQLNRRVEVIVGAPLS